MSKRTVELFTAGCLGCDDTVARVQDLACDSCEIIVYDLSTGCDTDECHTKARAYGVTSSPAVVVNGELAACCERSGVNDEHLRALGLGSR